MYDDVIYIYRMNFAVVGCGVCNVINSKKKKKTPPTYIIYSHKITKIKGYKLNGCVYC